MVVKNILMIALVLVSASFNYAHADAEIHSRVSPGFIRITDYANDSYGFQLCRDAAGKDCEQIGSRKYYSTGELNYRSKKLKREGFILIADDAGWLLMGTGVAVTAIMLSSNPVTAPVILLVAGTTAVSSMLGILHSWLTPGNFSTPIDRFGEAKSLNVTSIVQSNQVVLDIPIEQYAKKLNLALDDGY